MSYAVGPTGRRFARQLETARPGGFFSVYGTYAARIPEVQWATLTRAMEAVARDLQKAAIANVKSSRQRPQELSTGRLIASLKDEKQIVVETVDGKPKGFGFGNIAELDRGPARWYWRDIEEGTSRFVGRKLFGSFGSGTPEVDAGGGTAFPPPVLAKGGWSRPTQGERSGKRLPYSWRGSIPNYRKTVQWGRMTIKHPIDAHHYLLDAWKTVGVPKKMDDALTAWAAANGLPLSRVSISRSR
jgi:hypothetical protein